MKSTMKRVTVGTALGGALLASVGLGLANAEPRGDGQVDVVVGTSGTLHNVPVATAAQIVGSVCNRDVGQVTPAVEAVDANGGDQNVCNSSLGAVDLRQNDSSNAEGTQSAPTTAPSTKSTTPTSSALPVPTATHAPAQ
ncbi:hypothetical protein [Mycobacterium sp. UM_WWY]